MKIKKMLVLLILLFAVMLVFIPRVYAGGGSEPCDVIIGERHDNYDNYIIASQGVIKRGEKQERCFQSSDFDEYITELNKYLPEGVSLKANENKTYDIYLNNVNYNNVLFFAENWSGNIYLSGKNNIEYLSLNQSLYEAYHDVNIIGIGKNETNLDELYFDGKSTFKNCNINIDKELKYIFQYPLKFEGRVKIEIEPNSIIKGESLIDILKADGLYDEKNEEKDIYGDIYYKSPEAIIIRNYEDAKLLEQSVEKIKSGEALTFRFDKEIDKFEELYINNNLLTKNVDYTIESGSTIVKLSEEYTKKLAVGNYEVKAMFTDGEGTATFEVLGKAEEKVVEEAKEKEETKDDRTLDKTPKTGNENNNNYYYILLSVFITITLGIILKRKIK